MATRPRPRPNRTIDPGPNVDPEAEAQIELLRTRIGQAAQFVPGEVVQAVPHARIAQDCRGIAGVVVARADTRIQQRHLVPVQFPSRTIGLYPDHLIRLGPGNRRSQHHANLLERGVAMHDAFRDLRRLSTTTPTSAIRDLVENIRAMNLTNVDLPPRNANTRQLRAWAQTQMDALNPGPIVVDVFDGTVTGRTSASRPNPASPPRTGLRFSDEMREAMLNMITEAPGTPEMRAIMARVDEIEADRASRRAKRIKAKAKQTVVVPTRGRGRAVK